MKTLFALAALAALMNAQPTQKPAPEAPKVETPQNERGLTEAEQLKYRATMAEMKNIQEEFRIKEFNAKIAPKSNEQLAVIIAACKSVHVPEDKIQPRNGQPSECGFISGLDDDGNPAKGPDGRPIAAKVWWNRPTSTPTDPAVTAKK